MRHLSVPLDGPEAEAGSQGSTRSAEPRAAALVRDHFDFIWRLLRRLGLRRHEADDASQQVFMIATQKIGSVEVGSERTFLYGVALRVAANARRAIQRQQERTESSASEPPHHGSAPDELAELARACDLLDDLLEQLPVELRRVLVLAEIEQLEVREIAELERLAVGTAASRLRRARERFRTLLQSSAHRNPFHGSDE